MVQLLQRVCATLLLTLVAGTAWAQVTTATLTGEVTDEYGEGLFGATVTAVHEPTGTRYGITTLDEGRFTLRNLRVGGPYRVEASYVGYQSEVITDLFLQLGQEREISFTLPEGSVDLDAVTITANRNDILNSERTGAATNIDRETITRLPTISRSAADYYRLTPASDGNSFAGRNDQFNNFSLDGSIFNNPFGLDAATPGGQTDAQPISLDAIEQIQVSLAPYDVTQSGFTGAAVNAVTKSGTNEFHGTVFGFYRNQDLTGSKVEGEDIFVPELDQLQTGFSLGGPIIKNKLFFFVNAEIERRDDQGSNFIALTPDRSGEQVSRVEAQDLERVSQTLFDRFGYETGAYEDYIHETNNEKGIIKLDWNISQQHSLTATYNFLDASKQKPAHPSALGRRGPDATTLQFFNSGYQINNQIHSGILELRSLFGNKYSNKLQVGYTAFRDTRDPLSSPFPVLNINRDGIRYIVAGHEPFSINNRLNQDVFQITNNFNVFLGDHTLTIGGTLERFEFDNSFNLGVYEPFGVPYPGGTFGPGFESVQAFVDFVEAGSMDAVVDHARNLFETNQRPPASDDIPPGFDGTSWALAETNVGQVAAYIQDEWDVTRDFRLTLGLRVDIPLYYNTSELIDENILRNCCYDPSIVYYDENNEAITFDHTELPDNNPLISPRLGFNWDITGDQTAQLRGGSGLFTGRFPFVWVGNQVANPNNFFYTVTDPNFNWPQVWRSNLGGDVAFGDGWTVSADVIYTRDVNAMLVRNFGLREPTGTLQGPDNRPIYQANSFDRAFYTDFFTGDTVLTNAYVFTNTDIGRSFNTTVQLQRTWPNGLFTSIGYNYLNAEEASSIEAEISSDAYERNPAFGNVNRAVLAPSLYGNRHRIVGAANKAFTYGPWGTTIGLFFEYAEGGRFTYTYSGDINRDASGLNDLIYIPTTSELQQYDFESSPNASAEQQRAALENYIQQDEYLNGRRGQYAERYAILSPWFSTWDIRFLQDYNLPNGHTIQFSWDILNAGNLLNSDWGVRQFPTNTQPIGVSVGADDRPVYRFDPNLTETFTNDFSLNSRWQMQLGLRYIF